MTSILVQAMRELIQPGATMFIHAGPAESVAFRSALVDAPELVDGVTIVGAFIPGINDFDYAATGAQVATNFVPPTSRVSFKTKRHSLLPLNYSDLTRYFSNRNLSLSVLHSPPGRQGRYSLGLNADFGAAAAKSARRRLIVVNPSIPWTTGHELVEARDDDWIVENGASLLKPNAEEPDGTAVRVAARSAELVQDGDTVQIGIGKVPAAILRQLRGHRRIRLHTGIISDEVGDLVESGAIDLDRDTALVTGSVWGGPALHALAADARVHVAPARVTHDVHRIASTDNFVAINSAIEVDLFGQVNGEVVRGRRVSGVGGANDFARGARLSRGGRSLIAIPSTAGGRSRIVAALEPGSVSQAAADADHVATEHGLVSLRDLTLDERAEALLGIADPAHQDELAADWARLRASM